MKVANARTARYTDPDLVPEIRVEEADGDDIHAVRAVLILAYAEYQEALPPVLFTAYMEDLLDLERRTPTSQLLVARRGDRVLGAVNYYPDALAQGVGWPDEGWASVRALGVVPQARRQGVAGRLMTSCLDRARAAGSPVLGLHTGEFMKGAVRFYRRLGFRRAPHFDFDVPSSPAVVLPRVTARAYLRLLP